MARRCMVTGKGPMVGHNVSHANNKTKRRYLPNLQVTSVLSESLGRTIRLRVTTRGLRTIEHHGGFDAWLLETPDDDLPKQVRAVKRLVKKARENRAGA